MPPEKVRIEPTVVHVEWALPRESTKTQKIELIKTDRLNLDPHNPRLAGKEGRTDQPALLETLWREGSLDELTASIYENGYFPEEPLFAVLEDGKYIVVEGNRRLAAVKLLRDESLQKKIRATDIPKLSKSAWSALDELPVSVYPSRESLWAFLGFRHVNGPLTWDSWSKAQYIASVRNDFGVDLDEIADAIGDKNQTVRRLYRGLMVLNQSTEQAGYRLENRYKQHLSFSHLYTGLDYSGFERHLSTAAEGFGDCLRKLSPHVAPASLADTHGAPGCCDEPSTSAQ